MPVWRPARWPSSCRFRIEAVRYRGEAIGLGPGALILINAWRITRSYDFLPSVRWSAASYGAMIDGCAFFRASTVQKRGNAALTTQGAKIRYFFDLHDGRETFIAQEPNHFEGAEEARRQARRYLLEAAMDVIPVAGEQHQLSVVVRDDKRAVLRLFLIFTEERHAPDWPLAD